MVSVDGTAHGSSPVVVEKPDLAAHAPRLTASPLAIRPQTRHHDVVRSLLPLVITCSLLARCTCGETLTELVPDIDVDDAARALSRQIVGAPTTLVVQVGNRGTGVLELVALVEPADQGFAVASAPDTIRPRLAADVLLTFTPPARGTFAAVLVLQSNDPDEPEVRIPLSGEGGPAILEVTPSDLDFGLVNEGTAMERVLTVANVGFDVLAQLTANLEAGAVFTLDASALPPSLAPGEHALVRVTLLPSASSAAAEDDAGRLLDAVVVARADGDARVPITAGVNLAPVAIAVEALTRLHDVKVNVGRPITIDGSASFDPEDDAFTFTWTLLTRPGGSYAALVGQGQPTTRVTADEVGTYQIELRATDEHGAIGTDVVTLLPRDLAVVLRWQTDAGAACQALDEAACAALAPDERDDVCCGQSDLDLHLVRPGAALGDTGSCPGGCTDAQCGEVGDEHVATCRQTGGDCAWNNKAPEWGAVGRLDDPRLDVDDVRGGGPEVATLDLPGDGTFRVIVHYCNDRIGEPTLATVDVLVEGLLVERAGPELLAQGDAWTATTMVRESGGWTFVSPGGVVDDAPAGLCAP